MTIGELRKFTSQLDDTAEIYFEKGSTGSYHVFDTVEIVTSFESGNTDLIVRLVVDD